MEPRFNEVLRDWENWFVISRVRHIENLDLTNLRKNNHVRYILGWLIVFFGGVWQFKRVFSLHHLTIEHGKEHRTTDCKNKLVSWDHFQQTTQEQQI